MKQTMLVFMIALGLAACAGGGMGEPRAAVSIPVEQPLNQKPEMHEDNQFAETLSTGDSGNRVVAAQTYSQYGFPRKEFVYQVGDKVYWFSEYVGPMVPSYSSPSFEFTTSHKGQPLSDGSRLFMCCAGSSQSSYAPATKLDHVRYGAWISPKGEVDLFVGGNVSEAQYMPGGSDERVKDMKGKASYEVLAVRVRNGKFVTSSYTPSYGFPKDGVLMSKGDVPAVISMITANFNTNKLGGKIIGNQDFGSDIVMDDVDIVANGFKGKAVSDGVSGNVEGKFFGKPSFGWSTKPAVAEIGGKIVFDGRGDLNAVFGGTAGRRIATTDTSTDLAPIQ